MEPLREASPRASCETSRNRSRSTVAPFSLVPARLHEEKGHLVPLRALPEVLRQVPDLVVLCAGDGSAPRADQSARRRAWGPRSASGPARRRARAHRLSRLVALPSLAEPFDLAAVEAVSLGRPVVATRAGGLPEWWATRACWPTSATRRGWPGR